MCTDVSVCNVLEATPGFWWILAEFIPFLLECSFYILKLEFARGRDYEQTFFFTSLGLIQS